MNKYLVTGLIIASLSIVLVTIYLFPFRITGDVVNSEGINEAKLEKTLLKILYEKEYCAKENEKCAELAYPELGIFNAEEYTFTDQIVLVTTTTRKLREEMPETTGVELHFVFVKEDDTIVADYKVKGSAWSGNGISGTLSI